MSDNQRNVAKIIFILICLVLLIIAGLWAASAVFMALNHMSPAAARPTYILHYWELYGGQTQFKRSFAASFAVMLAIIVGLPCTVWFLSQQRKSLYGDAKFANNADIRKMKLHEVTSTSVLVGRKNKRYLVYNGNQFILTAAPTRSGKGVSLIIPNLLNYNDSCVVLDIKGENFNITSKFRATHGQKVYKFSPFTDETHRWNPLDYISDDPSMMITDAIQLSYMLYPDATDGRNSFFPPQARALFLAFVLYLKYTPALPCTIGQIIQMADGGNSGKPIHEYIVALLNDRMKDKSLPPLPLTCTQKFNAFVQQSDETRTSILGTFANPLNIWNSGYVDAATSGSDFNLRDVRKQRMTIYFEVPAKNLPEARVLLNIFYSQLIGENLRELPQENPELKYQCLLMMDEFTAAGAIDIIQKSIAYIAGYNMRLFIIIQNKSQLLQHYGEHTANSITSNVENMIMFTPATHPPSDAEEYSKILGNQTAKGLSKSRSLGGRTGRTESESEQRRPLMLPQELLEMPLNKEIIKLRGQKPIYCDKICYYDNPDFVNRLKTISPTLNAFKAMPSEGLYAKAVQRKELSIKIPALNVSFFMAKRENKTIDIPVEEIAAPDFDIKTIALYDEMIASLDGDMDEEAMTAAIKTFVNEKHLNHEALAFASDDT